MVAMLEPNDIAQRTCPARQIEDAACTLVASSGIEVPKSRRTDQPEAAAARYPSRLRGPMPDRVRRTSIFAAQCKQNKPSETSRNRFGHEYPERLMPPAL